MRALLVSLALASPASAWEFSPVPVCTLSGGSDDLEVTVTYDPRRDEPYAIVLISPDPWPAAPVFALAFEGPRGIVISTSRHVLSGDGRSLTVTDRGFGNVLDGLEFNVVAAARLGPASRSVSLSGAAEPVQEFRDCTRAPVA